MKSLNIAEIQLDGQTHYFTDNQTDYTHNGNTYLSGMMENLNSVVVNENGVLEESSITVKFSAIDQTLISLFSTSDYKGRRFLAKRLEFDDSRVLQSEEVIIDAVMSRYLITNREKTRTIDVEMVSWHSMIRKENALDLSVVFADYINDTQLDYWGRHAPSTGGEGYRWKRTPFVENPTNIGDP